MTVKEALNNMTVEQLVSGINAVIGGVGIGLAIVVTIFGIIVAYSHYKGKK